MPPDEKERFIESGSFRVDREKALEKLERYQLADPWDFAAAWARMAVDSGATRLEASTSGETSLLRFDGRPLPEALLLDPLSGLFGEEGDPRGRTLAVGFLALLKLQPSSLEIRSGSRTWRHGADGDRTERSEAAVGTHIQVAWPSAAAREHAGRFVREFKVVLSLADLDFIEEGRSLGRRHAESESGVRKTASSGRTICARRGGNVYAGTVHVHHRGVRVHASSRAATAGVEVHVQDDELRLDYTGCLVAWDRRMGDTVQLAEASVAELFPTETTSAGVLPVDRAATSVFFVLFGGGFVLVAMTTAFQAAERGDGRTATLVFLGSLTFASGIAYALKRLFYP